MARVLLTSAFWMLLWLEWREHRTYRCYCGSTPVHIRSPKSSPAMRISLFSNLHEGYRLVSLKCESPRYGPISGHHRGRHMRTEIVAHRGDLRVY